MPNLTTVANVEAYLGVTSSPAVDALAARLIAAASSSILAYLGRPNILPRTVTEIRDGTGGPRLMLREWPVTAVSALTIDGTAVLAGSYSGAPGSSGWAGYYFEAWNGVPPGRRVALELNGSTFCRNPQNVSVTYSAGYLVANEAATVPASPYTVTAQAPYGSWATDQGVTYASGAALTKVSGAPSAGQYQLGATPGTYVFSAADSAAAVLISYGFVPAAIEEACIEMVASSYNASAQMGGFGNVRMMRAGDTEMEFTPVGTAPGAGVGTVLITPSITTALQPYRSVSPA